MNNKIVNYSIVGERCSGTNFLESVISNVFDLKITWKYGWKHWFTYHNFEDSDQTLFIGIVRDPYKWMESLYRTPHHLNQTLRESPMNYLTSEWWSYYDCLNHGELFGNEIMIDRNYETGERYKNIFEMRASKNRFLANVMPVKVKNFILIRYEDLKDKFEDTLQLISDMFCLSMNNNHCNLKNIVPYTKKSFIEKEPIFSQEIIEYIKLNLEMDIEQQLGYC